MIANGVREEEGREGITAVLAAIACMGAGGIAALSRGLYFTDDLAVLVLMSAGILLTAILLAGGAMAGRGPGRGMIRDMSLPAAGCGSKAGQLIRWLLLGSPFFIAMLYAVHLLAGPLSVQATGEAVLRWSFCGCFGLLVCFAISGAKGRTALRIGWSFLGLLLVGAALASVYGLIPFPEAVLRTDQAEVSASGARLGGTLQYPNTFGAVMGMFLLERLMILARMERADFTRRNGWRGYIAAGSAFFYILCLLLTESRGACLSTAAAWTVGLYRLRAVDRFRYARQGGALLLCGWAAAGQLSASSLAPPLLPGLLWLAVAAAAAMIAVNMATWTGQAQEQEQRKGHGCGQERGYGEHHQELQHGKPNKQEDEQGLRHSEDQSKRAGDRAKQRQRARRKQKQRLELKLGQGQRRLVAATIILLGAGLLGTLPSQGLLERASPLATLSARALMYYDGWSLFLSSPWVGQGGKTWGAMFRSIQSLPYVGAEVHSGYLNIGLDLGLAGLAVLLLWLVGIGAALVYTRSRMLPSFLVLLLHSAADFDMSYGLTWLLVIWMAASGYARHPASAAPTVRTASARPLFRSFLLLSAGLLMLVGLAGARQAASLAQEQQALAASASGRPEQATALLQQSLAMYPARSSARLHLAGLSAADEQAAVLQPGLAYDRANPDLWAALGRALSGSRPLEAAAAWEQAVELDPYSWRRQTEALGGFASLVSQLQRSQRPEEALAAARSGYKLYVRYEKLARRLAAAPDRRNDRRFSVTAEAKDRGRELGEYVHRYSPGYR